MDPAPTNCCATAAASPPRGSLPGRLCGGFFLRLDRMSLKITPPELARRWGISADKVLAWIASGDLPAMNGATRRGGRARYLIDLADIEQFEIRRAVLPPAPRVSRQRRKQH